MQFGYTVCPYCSSSKGFVYIHGHYQCVVCNQNVMPCCGGEQEVISNSELIEPTVNSDQLEQDS
jgi:DNA-directed RNA polymerase subunit RPC12/RpoP